LMQLMVILKVMKSHQNKIRSQKELFKVKINEGSVNNSNGVYLSTHASGFSNSSKMSKIKIINNNTNTNTVNVSKDRIKSPFDSGSSNIFFPISTNNKNEKAEKKFHSAKTIFNLSSFNTGYYNQSFSEKILQIMENIFKKNDTMMKVTYEHKLEDIKVNIYLKYI
jgi:hypothetical protein